MLDTIYGYTLYPFVLCFDLWVYLIFNESTVTKDYSYFWDHLDWRDIP